MLRHFEGLFELILWLIPLFDASEPLLDVARATNICVFRGTAPLGAYQRQWITGHVIAPHHPSLLVSARIGLAEVHTNYRMVDYVATDPEINQLSPHSFKNGS